MFKFVMSAVLAAMLGGMVATTVAQADSKVAAPQSADVPFPASLIGTYSTLQEADNAAREYKARNPHSQVEIRKILGLYEVWGN